MRAALCSLLVATLAACGPGPPSESEATVDADPAPAADAGPTAGPAPPKPEARPATLRDTVRVEGVAQPVTLRLVTVEDVPLPFSTYVRDGWSHDVVSSGEGTAVQFTAGDGLVSLFVPTEAGSEADVLPFAEAAAASRGAAEPLAVAGLPPWASAGYTFSGGDEAGRALVGQHGGTWFQVLVAYPIEIADGFVPGADVVLDRLRWTDTGTGLSP